MDEPAEDVASADYPASVAGIHGLRRIKVESAMRSSAIVVTDVLGEDRLEVASAEDQEVVQAFFSDGAHEPLRVGVRPRGSDRRLDGLDADGGEHCVERRGELGVSVCAHQLGHRARRRVPDDMS